MKRFPGYESLRLDRVNVAEAHYFMTLCTRDRIHGLHEGGPANAIAQQLHAMRADDAMTGRAWVIMPDHVHVFFRLARATLGQIAGRLKAKTREALATHGLAWQGNYYEHRLREGDATEDVLRYMLILIAPDSFLRRSCICIGGSAQKTVHGFSLAWTTTAPTRNG
jgi:REP element-mobilizing transposase RayT